MSDADPPTQERLWVDIDSPQDIVVTGLLQILESEFGAALFTTVGPVDGEPDVVLYDVIGLHPGDASELDRLHRLTGSVVIAVSYDGLRRDLEELALDRGAAAVIPLSISAEELAEVIRATLDGRLEDIPAVRTRHNWDSPGKEVGLSPRESDVLALIVRGMSNEEIGPRVLSQRELREDLHPQRLPQDRRQAPRAGRGVGHDQRLRAGARLLTAPSGPPRAHSAPSAGYGGEPRPRRKPTLPSCGEAPRRSPSGRAQGGPCFVRPAFSATGPLRKGRRHGGPHRGPR